MLRKKHRLAVIGYGGMGGWHAKHALGSDVVELAGVYDINPERNRAAEAAGIRAYASPEALLGDPEIELITLAVPNDQHKPLAVACLEAGKHVVCEKPVMLSAADLEDVFAAARRCGRLFTVHQNRRWDVDYLAVRQLFQTGALGEVFNLESRIHGSRGIPSDWRGRKEYGGGMLYDWGVHLIDQILCLYEGVDIGSVYCEFQHITNAEVDDGFKLTLHFQNGARAYIEVGTYNFIALPRFYAQGMKGTAVIPDWREPCHVVECFAWNERDVLPVQTAAGLTKTMAPRDEITTRSFELERPASDVHDFYRNVCAALEGREPLLVTHGQMLRTLRVIEAAFASAAQKAVIAFSER